jgi:hypothetical protein
MTNIGRINHDNRKRAPACADALRKNRYRSDYIGEAAGAGDSGAAGALPDEPSEDIFFE